MDHLRSLPLLFPEDPAEPPAESVASPVAEPAAEAAPREIEDIAAATSGGDGDGEIVTEALDRGATVVTANQRTARTIRQTFERRQRAAGATFWQPPNVLAWDAWTATLWRRLLLDGHAASLLLSPAQEHQVWRSIIANDPAWSGLATVDALADMAANAWSLLGSYRAHARLRTAAVNENTEDTRAFLRWAQAFRRRCQSDSYLAHADLEETILHAIATQSFSMGSSELLLAGFDKMTPAQTALIAALRDTGVTINSWTPEVPSTQHLHAAADPEAELHAAAHWIRHLLQANAAKGIRVAVILPSAASERAAIDRVFREVLAPELLPITAGTSALPYEFSLGQPLARVPMIATALDLLRWSQRALPLETLSRLLLSPFFTADEAERGPRAEFDAFALRRSSMLRPELSLDALITRAEDGRHASRLGGLLRQLRSLRRTAATLFSGEPQRTYADWADAMRQLLESANWASASRSEDSIAFQTRRKWESTLDQLATLDFEGVRPTFTEALEALRTLLHDTLFAPESREAPVQIMGPLEAGGSEFDAVWFLRAGDLDWPARSSINPLLGWPLQRAVGMPGADAATDREHARRITQRIAASAPTVIFSYARETAESPQRPSTLLSDLTFAPIEEGTTADAAEQPIIQLEAVADDDRIPLANPHVRGGASVLKSQAACGFRAFAERRLWSTELEPAEPGMDARERGDLVHVTLQRFWDEVRTQAALNSMPPEERTAALDRAISEALSKCISAAATAWEAEYVDTQRERLRRLLVPWIEQERARQLPFTVKAREEAMEVAVGPLRLKLRIDRIDATDAGDVLIDYKTGAASHKDWLTERPDEPQLPLYAMITDAQLAAIAFGRIRPGKEMGLDGYSATDGILPKPAPLPFETLDDQVAEWRRILTNLAEDFHAGDARVHPKSYPKTCQHCAQRLLCRLNPATLATLGDHEDHADPDHQEETHA